jgi:hypothetical protein
VSGNRAKISLYMIGHFKPPATDQDLAIDEEYDDAEQFMEKALPVISASLAKVGTTPYLIKDVHAFKASLQMLTGPVIQDLAEFEDTNKLQSPELYRYLDC